MCGIPKSGTLKQGLVLAYSYKRQNERSRRTYDLITALTDLNMADFAHFDVKSKRPKN